MWRKLGIFYTLRLTPEAKTRTLIGFIAKKHCEEKNLSSEKIRHTSMVNSWKIKKMSIFLFYHNFLLRLSLLWTFVQVKLILFGEIQMANFCTVVVKGYLLILSLERDNFGRWVSSRLLYESELYLGACYIVKLIFQMLFYGLFQIVYY